MQAAVKVVHNTVVLYCKMLVTMSISLVSVPLVLRALGASDYGLYSLVAGIVAMLSFLNNSMTVSTQRYMSVAIGEGNMEKIDEIYNASFLLHGILAMGIVIALELFGVPSIGKLNIEPDRSWCASLIFQFLVLSVFSKIIAVPFDAIMNAHEDMFAFSVIEIIDAILLLTVSLTLMFIPFDKLTFYGFSVALISILTLLMKCVWCIRKYKKYKVSFKHKPNLGLVKKMLGFTGWNLFGGLSMMGRNQGVAVLFNLFLGTLANAAYGVANQINGAMSQFSSTFQRAINPQLMKSEGMGNRERLHKISFISSKFSVLALCFFSIPLIIEMDDVLHIWLKDNIPSSTMELTRCILVLSIFTQLSTGLMSAIQATGHIRNYQIVMGSIILTNVPATYIILKLGYPIYYVTLCFIAMEIISFITRLFMAKKIVGIDPFEFIKNVFLPVLKIVISAIALALIPFFLIETMWLRLILVCIIFGSTYVVMTWLNAFNLSQRIFIKNKLIGAIFKKRFFMQ